MTGDRGLEALDLCGLLGLRRQIAADRSPNGEAPTAATTTTMTTATMTTAPSLEDLGFTGPEPMTASDRPRTRRLTRGRYRRFLCDVDRVPTDFLVVTNVLDDRSWGNRDRCRHRCCSRVASRTRSLAGDGCCATRSRPSSNRSPPRCCQGPQREENRARYFLDRHRLPDARFSAGGDRKDIRLCLDSEVDMVEPGATLVERLARIVRDLCLAQRSGDVVRDYLE